MLTHRHSLFTLGIVSYLLYPWSTLFEFDKLREKILYRPSVKENRWSWFCILKWEINAVCHFFFPMLTIVVASWRLALSFAKFIPKEQAEAGVQNEFMERWRRGNKIFILIVYSIMYACTSRSSMQTIPSVCIPFRHEGQWKHGTDKWTEDNTKLQLTLL